MDELEEKKEPLGFGHGVVLGVLFTVAGAVILLCILIWTGVFKPRTGIANQDVLSQQAIEKIEALSGLIDLYYLEEVNRETEEQGLYKGLVASLGDPYSEYFTPEEYEDQRTNVTKQYYGIGATLTKDSDSGEVTVVYVYEGTPAERAGLKVSDKIVSANGIEATSMDLDSFVDEIRGEEGTDVTLVVEREGKDEPLTFVITREEVNLPTVQYELLSDDIGYIYLSRFALNTPQEFEDAVADLTKQGMKAMIVDVRYNPGGIVSSVVQILDDILPKGTVVYTEDKYGKRADEVSDEEHKMTLPIAVLINGDSASASEIFAGAIRDFDYGTLIGTTTFGKGIVQQTIPLTDGSAIKLTVEEYFTPSGENIHGIGIDPDIELEYEFLGDEDEEYSYDLDNQIQKAVEILKKEL